MPTPNARCNLAPGKALGAQLSNPVRVQLALGSPQALSASPCHRQAEPHALADQLALEFRDAGEDAEHEAAIRRRSVHALVRAYEFDPQSPPNQLAC